MFAMHRKVQTMKNFVQVDGEDNEIVSESLQLTLKAFSDARLGRSSFDLVFGRIAKMTS